VNSTIRADDNAVVSRMRAPAAGVKRLDLEHQVRVGGELQPEARPEDVPLDPDTGEVLSMPAPAFWPAWAAGIRRGWIYIQQSPIVPPHGRDGGFHQAE
jgi:hypothetical protein